MFNCAKCSRTAEPGESMTRIVTKERFREYIDASGKVIGRGYETVEEVGICPRCAAERKASIAA